MTFIVNTLAIAEVNDKPTKMLAVPFPSKEEAPTLNLVPFEQRLTMVGGFRSSLFSRRVEEGVRSARTGASEETRMGVRVAKPQGVRR